MGNQQFKRIWYLIKPNVCICLTKPFALKLVGGTKTDLLLPEWSFSSGQPKKYFVTKVWPLDSVMPRGHSSHCVKLPSTTVGRLQNKCNLCLQLLEEESFHLNPSASLHLSCYCLHS